MFPGSTLLALAQILEEPSARLSSVEMAGIKGGSAAPGQGGPTAGSATDCDPKPRKPDPDSTQDNVAPQDPVLLTGGKFYFPIIDVEIPGRGRMTGNNLQFFRSYSSQDGYDQGALGPGWVTNLDISLFDNGGSSVVVRDFDGSLFELVSTGPGIYVDGRMKVEKQLDGSYIMTKTFGTRYKFDAAGKIQYLEDRNGNKITYNYSGAFIVSLTDASGQTLHFVYGGNNKLSGMTDPLGRQWAYSYDGSGNLISVTDPLGRTSTYQYNDPLDPHNMTSVVDAMGHATAYQYNNEDRVVAKTKPDGSQITFSYNTFLGTSTLTDEAGNTWSYEYISIGLTTAVIDPENGVDQFAYDTNTNLMTSHTDALNRTTAYQYDANQNLVQVTDPAGGVWQYTYDPTFNVWVTRTDPNGHTVVRTLDAKGNVIKFKDAMGSEATVGYDGNGLPVGYTDRKGNTTAFAYDAHGNLVQRTDPLGNVTSATYDAGGRRLTLTDARGNTTQQVFDAGNRLLKVIRPNLSELNFAYDADDNLVSQTDPLGHATSFTYNSLHLETAMTDPLGHVTSYSYDSRENLTSVTDANGNTTGYTYDKVHNRLTMGAVSAQYDAAGNQIRITDPMGRQTNLEYDALNRLVKTVFPDSTTEESTYDAAGNMLTHKNRAGQTATMTYDANNRMVSKGCPTCGATFTYDAENLLVAVNDAVAGSFSFEFDAMRRLKKSTQPGGQIVQYRYNPVGLRKKLIYPDGSEIEYRYDSLDRLQKIIDGGDEYNFNYDAADRRQALIYPNGIKTAYDYDDAGRLTMLKTKEIATGDLISKFDYTLDPVGNPGGIERKIFGQPVETSSYSFDQLGRLTDVARPGLSKNYAYDPAGNRTTVTENASATSYLVNNLNQYTQVGAQTLSYDTCGNLTGDGQLTMSYDTDNRLTQVTSGSDTIGYSYDWANRLTVKTVNGATTRYVYDGKTVIAEAGNGGNLKIRYVVGDRVDEVLAQKKTGSTLYLSRDGLGSTTEVTKPNGNVQQRYKYDEFGAVTVTDKNGAPVPDAPKTNYLFTGREYQPETGLYNFRNRFYHPGLGRFLQPDPLGVAMEDTNLYTYVHNNPLRFTDPFGLQGSGGQAGPGSSSGCSRSQSKDRKRKKDRQKQQQEQEDVVLDFGPLGAVDLGALLEFASSL